MAEVRRNLYDGIQIHELGLAQVMAARSLVEQEPNYAYVSARLLLNNLRDEALGFILPNLVTGSLRDHDMHYAEYFPEFVKQAVKLEILDKELQAFDLPRLATAIRPERDRQFQFLGLQTLYDRYFLHKSGVRFELPQAFFMRVAMGLAVREIDRDARAIEFYELLSSFDFMCSTPTLFNAGTLRPQLSSCFLTTVSDDLDGIFKAIKDNALLSKYAGGLGNDWSGVRGLGSHIRGTNGRVPGRRSLPQGRQRHRHRRQPGRQAQGRRLRLSRDLAHRRRRVPRPAQEHRRRPPPHARHEHGQLGPRPLHGARRGRRPLDPLLARRGARACTTSTAAPSPQKYEEYEAKAARGEIKVTRTIRALDLWRRMLSMLFETGHPWVTFKDPCNLRSPQQHVGVVHSSNLCTEITLNTSAKEIAVCNLGSINLANHTTDKGLDAEHLKKTVTTAMRMLDNVIDINFYTVPEARYSNLRHRPVGLGIMGYQDALYTLRIPFSSDQAVKFADTSMEMVSYYAISASVDLAAERGRYTTFEGSLWSKGILPIDSVDLLQQNRSYPLQLELSSTLDWNSLRERVVKIGMRHSNTMAIAPTATISNICGVTQSIEPTYQNLFVKSNMSGDFTVVNAALVHDLKERGLWDEVMISDLKYFDGSLGAIDRVPEDLKTLYATSFEVDATWLIQAAARRQKWIDQAQSLNLYIAQPSGKKLDALYREAWHAGLKTTYYLRSRSATHVEKSTLKRTDGKLNAVSLEAAAAPIIASPKVCSIDDPTCEACQ